ncbi:transglycosylase domain-containing protein [Paenibacillus psychroresistens]|uniref:transglycosylase domain-containing protein n=1 Tax=Paenibacillus psychroresistens TaxID=1778678 RepID=UPI001D046963|nr:transglycosylase domain-containing protein [Paenibacillus psychroresistens]
MLHYIIKIITSTAVTRPLLIIFLTIKWMLILVIIAGLLAAGAAFGYASALVKDDPVRSKDMIYDLMSENSTTGFVYFNDNTTLLGQLRTEEDRRLATLDEIPQIIKDATLSIEDKNFYENNGVDMNGLLRAVEQRLRHEEIQTGGSTITQQLVRRTFLTLDREDSRKFKEILLSMRVTRIMSKDEILLAYLNKIPYGNGSSGYNLSGIKAAAKGIFDKDKLIDLNIAQSAYLAGLPQSPSNYSAFNGKGEFDNEAFEKAVNREELVLRRMLEENKITQAEYDDALAFDLKKSLAKTKAKAYTTYPYLMIEVENNAADAILKQQYPDLVLDTDSKKAAYNEALKDVHLQMQRGGYKIYTTIDKTIYDSMQVIAKNPKNFSPDDKVKGTEQIGALMIDNNNGAILGMIEGRNFYEEQLNHATQAFRQPGSTMKPLAAYGPGIEMGLVYPAAIIDDSPIVLKDQSSASGFHVPMNWNSKFQGLITARKALNMSYNIPALRIFLNEVGMKNAWDYVKKLGINSLTPDDYLYAQTGVIGGLSKGVSVKEMTAAYSTFANKGVHNDAYLISKIVDGNGKVIFEHQKKPTNVFTAETAFLMTDMMRTVITAGTATDLMKKFKNYGKIPIVGKTGSTQDDGDAWFMGYTPDITVGVWAGYDQFVHKLSKPGGTNRAKDIWALIMDTAISKKPALFPTKTFEKPANIITMAVSNLSGLLPSELTKASGHTVSDLINKKQIPTKEDDVLVKMKFLVYNKLNYLPNPLTPEEFLQEKVVVKRKESLTATLKQIKEIMAKTPASKRRSMDAFIPLDIAANAPEEIDPRIDDNLVPDAPANVILKSTAAENKLTFSPSLNPNIVGYRIYRSLDGVTFEKQAKVITTDQPSSFIDPALPGGNAVGYYITSVNIVGKESVPSSTVLSAGTVVGPITENTDDPDPDTGAIVIAPAPTTPIELSFQMNGVNLQIDWTPNPAIEQITQYDVYFSETETGNYQKIGTAFQPQFEYFSGLYKGYYSIIAINNTGESSSSTPVAYSTEQ